MYDGATTTALRMVDNLFLGFSGGPRDRVVDWRGGFRDSTIDVDGWFPDGQFSFGAYDWGGFALTKADGLFETHGTLVGQHTLASGLDALPDPSVTMLPQDVSLAEDSAAIDAGMERAPRTRTWRRPRRTPNVRQAPLRGGYWTNDLVVVALSFRCRQARILPSTGPPGVMQDAAWPTPRPTATASTSPAASD